MARGRLYIPSSLHYAILQHLFEPSRNRGHQGAVIHRAYDFHHELCVRVYEGQLPPTTIIFIPSE